MPFSCWLASTLAGHPGAEVSRFHVQVGYLLGLGDRHPSNLMLDRYSGKLLHIDFGDCFEASMHREKFPEKAQRPPLCDLPRYI